MQKSNMIAGLCCGCLGLQALGSIFYSDLATTTIAKEQNKSLPIKLNVGTVIKPIPRITIHEELVAEVINDNAELLETETSDNEAPSASSEEEVVEEVIEDGEIGEENEEPSPLIDGNVYWVPSNGGFKSYMPYTAISSVSSPQYQLQLNAYTDSMGLRMVNGRYCVALGSHFNCGIGQAFDLVLENGVVIPCIMADQKADGDTDDNNIFTGNGCMSEFLVDKSELDHYCKIMGSVSYAYDGWDSPVDFVIVY